MTRKFEPNYVDLMETWTDVVMVVFFYLIIAIGSYAFVSCDSESLLFCLTAANLPVGIFMFPGIFLVACREELYQCLAKTSPVYEHPQSIFRVGLKQLRHLRIGGSANIAALVAMLVLAGLVVILALVGIVWDDFALDLAIVLGGLLAWLGVIIIGSRLIYDAFAARKSRWLI